MNTTITWQEHSADELKYEKMVTDENYVVTVTDINNDLSYKEYKSLIVEYGKNSKFPDIN